MVWTLDKELIKKCLTDQSLSLSCKQLHGAYSCNKLALMCFFNTIKASYRTYCFVYLLSILMKIKTITKNLKQEGPKIIFNLIKSICFTAIDMMIMRKITCLYNKYIGFDSKSLIYSNIIGGIALQVQSHGRQIEIALYALNKSIQTFYNAFKRRYNFTPIVYGEALLFALSISIICYHYANNQECMRKTYVKIFDLFFKNV